MYLKGEKVIINILSDFLYLEILSSLDCLEKIFYHKNIYKQQMYFLQLSITEYCVNNFFDFEFGK